MKVSVTLVPFKSLAKIMTRTGLAVLLTGVWGSTALAVKIGDVLPKISINDHNGKAQQPWVGKASLINFWATWCDACKVELREMEKELAKVSPNNKVIFVSLDKDAGKAKDWMAAEFKGSASMSESLFHDATFTLADALGIESFPMTIIVDAAGKVIKIQDGFKDGQGSTAKLFEALNQTK